MSDDIKTLKMATLAQAILNVIEKHQISDQEAIDVCRDMAFTLKDGYSDWASELIYEANELRKDGRDKIRLSGTECSLGIR